MAQASWTAIGLSRDLEPGAVAGVIVEGREWALWRGASGHAHVWEDRCPHRGMRVSFGFVRGDRLACLYHGWQYDEGGLCRYIPAHPELEVPDTIRIAGVGVVESGAILWAAFAGEAGAAPDHPEAAPVRSLYLDAPLEQALRALAGVAKATSDGAYLVENEGDRLLIGVQANDAAHCALHIALIEPPADARTLQRKHALWAESLRRAVEGGR